MNIDSDGRVYVWAPQARFPWQEDPPHVVSEQPWNSGPGSWAVNDGMAADYDLQCVHPGLVRIPANNILAPGLNAQWDAEYAQAVSANGVDTSLPTLLWSTVGGEHTLSYVAIPTWGGTTDGAIGLYLAASTFLAADTGVISLQATVNCTAFAIALDAKTQPSRGLAAGSAGGVSTTPNDPVVVAAGVRVGPTVWRVRLSGGEVRIERRDVGAWETVQMVPRVPEPRSNSGTFTAGQADEPLSAEFRLIGGRIRITVGEHGRPFIFEAPGATVFDRAVVEGRKLLAITVRGQQVRWRANASLDSAEISLGFTAPSAPAVRIRAAGDLAAGWTVDAVSTDGALDTRLGPQMTYRLVFAGPVDGTYKSTDWASVHSAVRSVDLIYPGRVRYSPEGLIEMPAFAVDVSHTFDPSTLQVSSSATLEMTANRRVALPTGEVGAWSEWLLNYGQTAMEVWCARTALPTGSLALQRLFTGYGCVRSDIVGSGGGMAVRVACEDRRRQLSGPRFGLPWMDGWNHFYAIAYLAALGGVTRDDLDFAGSVPPGPMDNSLDEDLQPAYFLPVGGGGSVITRVSGQNLWDIMTRIAYSAGYMLFFGLDGRLQYRKFRLPVGIKRWFFESDRGSALAGGGAEGCWDLRVSKTMDDVRSELVVVGMNDFDVGQPIIVRREDPEVWSDPSAYNHLGYRQPSAWIDSRFANVAYAESAADAVFRTLRTPGVTVTLRTWLQPDIWPLDVIGVETARAGLSGVPLCVLGARHRVGLGEPGESTILARAYVPESYGP